MKDEMSGACSTRGKNLRKSNKIWSENVKRKDHLRDLDVDVGITLMDLKEVGREDVDCFRVVQDRDQRRALVSMVINLRVP
jgi:hypothetical protein